MSLLLLYLVSFSFFYEKGTYFLHFIYPLSSIQASCAIPFYFGYYPALKVRDHYGIDGFFAIERSRFGCPPTPAKDVEIIVCPFEPSTIRLDPKEDKNGKRIEIISLKDSEEASSSLSLQQLLNLALLPPGSPGGGKASDEEILSTYNYLYDVGKNCAESWSLNTDLGEILD